MQPHEGVPDIKSDIFDRDHHAMERARCAECCDMGARLHHAVQFGPDIRTECNVATIPFLIHEALIQALQWQAFLALRHAARIAHATQMVRQIGDDASNAISWQGGDEVETIATEDKHTDIYAAYCSERPTISSAASMV